MILHCIRIKLILVAKGDGATTLLIMIERSSSKQDVIYCLYCRFPEPDLSSQIRLISCLYMYGNIYINKYIQKIKCPIYFFVYFQQTLNVFIAYVDKNRAILVSICDRNTPGMQRENTCASRENIAKEERNIIMSLTVCAVKDLRSSVRLQFELWSCGLWRRVVWLVMPIIWRNVFHFQIKNESS
jgi:hypothetical protein